MKIYFATWLTDITLGISLTKKRANSRLASFHFLKEQQISVENLSKYAKVGRVDVRKTKKR